MKNLLTLLVLISASCSAQVLTIKLANPKTFNTANAINVTTDSITISNIKDSGIDVQVDVYFYEPGNTPFPKTEHIVLWTGSTYITNQNWTKPSVKAAVKTYLQNQ